jgi:hypothetical protein
MEHSWQISDKAKAILLTLLLLGALLMAPLLDNVLKAAPAADQPDQSQNYPYPYPGYPSFHYLPFIQFNSAAAPTPTPTVAPPYP